MAVPVHIIAGFLGSGKTTTLLRLVERHRHERLAIVVNDFGEAGIDAVLLGETGSSLAEIPGACVCCTAPEGFVRQVGELLDRVRPDRILVEPTGLARPADLVDTLRRAPYAERLEVGPVIVLVDPAVVARGEFHLLREQGEAADLLVAHRVDLCSEADLSAFDAWRASLWPGPARVLRAVRGELPADVLTWRPDAKRDAPAHDHPEAGHDAVAWSHVWTPEVVFDRDRLADALARWVTGRVGPSVLRLKGLFRTIEGVFLVEVAGGRVHERPTTYRRDSRVDVLVEGTDATTFTAIASTLEAARQTEDEARTRAEVLELVLPDGTRRVFDRASLAELPNAVPDVSALIPGRVGKAARVAALLSAAGCSSEGLAVAMAADGYATAPVPVEALREAVLVHSVGDEPLPSGQGGPFRLLIPGDAGPGGPCSNVKGVVRIAIRGVG